jgi:serine/threonine protein kinase/DNA-directed RNA polymerase subunit RPC12/RpoP
MTQPTCPDVHSWQDLLEGGGAGREPDELAHHLEACAACQHTLETLAAEPAVWEDAARALGEQQGQAGREPALQDLVERLKREQPPAVEEDLSFLRPADKPGLLGLLGPYEVREVIGRGGMGVVLKAFEPALHRVVAIKVMAAALAGNATARRRFTREARAAAAVSHDHVVAVHGVSEAGGLPYLVMQYVAGESLQARLDRTGPLEVAEAVRIGLQTAAGLAAAHAQGLIHRDIKPANLLLEDGVARVKISDFGLARMADDVQLTQAGVVAGTPEYMAPEQARGEQVDPRADLFSLGSVLYACCTGLPPFRGPTPLAVLRRVSDEAPPPIRSLNPEVPAWLEALVARLMAKDPAQRFQTAAEVAALLEGYLAHLRQPGVSAPQLPPSPPVPRAKTTWPSFLSPRPLVFLALAALGLLGSLLVLAALLREKSPPDPERAVAALEKLGATIQRDGNQPGNPVVVVRLKDTKVTDADLEPLAAFPQLRILDLTGATNVTDSALKGLASLTRLQELYLGQTTVTDAGLKDLAPLTNLQKLGLEATGVTDAGLKDVAVLTQLQYLNLGRTAVTDAGLKDLAPLTQLQVLGLYHTGMTDAGLKELAAFPQLQKLMLGDTAVTDAGLKDLAGLKELKRLEVPRTKVTATGVQELKAAIPGVDVMAPGAEEPARSGSRGWLTAAGILVGVLSLSLLGAWLWTRRRHRPGTASAAAPVPRPEAAGASVLLRCSGCGRRLKGKAELAGKKLKCPQCGQAVLVPSIQTGEPGRTSG